MNIRVVLADDHRIVREGLGALLAREADIDLVGQAQDGLAAVKLARDLHPDVVVTDISMPGLNGIEAIRRIRSEDPAPRVLCLSVHDDSRMVLAVLDAGAAGYVLKHCSYEELAQAIRKVMANQIHLSAELVGIVVEEVRARAAPKANDARAALTPREREMVQLLSEGHTTQQIAERLHVSAKTVATHREHVLHKLHIKGIAELTRYALREGLTSLDV
ncbi:response regulator transcription factor [Piscinibacter sp.]|uniref:response regulator transcription factor n=1 Tax=Piscinibacter sp. TaxID=1903157 RepID=UPI002B55FA8A|nr:response regulator transcription factor [Albitalea sp.]HUG26180.1 response regulator transcription factor [Albitalea sp.]